MWTGNRREQVLQHPAHLRNYNSHVNALARSPNPGLDLSSPKIGQGSMLSVCDNSRHLDILRSNQPQMAVVVAAEPCDTGICEPSRA